MTTSMAMIVTFKYQMSHDIDTARDEYEEMFDMIREAGFQAVDVTSYEIDTFGEDYVRETLKRHGIKVSSYICFEDFISEKNQEKAISNGLNSIDLAKKFDSKVAMMVPMWPQEYEETDREKISQNMAVCWKPIAAYGKKQGVHVVIEDTPDQRIPLCSTEELKYILEAVPDIEVVYDSGNMLLAGENPVRYFDTFKQRIAHIHIKDMRYAADTEKWADIARDGRKMICAPTGDGIVDIPTLMSHIKESGYEDYLTIEFCKDFHSGYVESMEHARDYLEKIMGSE